MLLRTIHSILSKWVNEALVLYSNEEKYYDKDAVWAILVGIALGIAILVFLTVFPGEPLDHVYGKNNTSSTEEKILRPGISSSSSSSRNNIDSSNSQSSRRRPTTEAVEHATNNESIISILGIVNMGMYVLLFSTLVYYLNRDYDDFATRWFVRTFPREAETLGVVEL